MFALFAEPGPVLPKGSELHQTVVCNGCVSGANWPFASAAVASTVCLDSTVGGVPFWVFGIIMMPDILVLLVVILEGREACRKEWAGPVTLVLREVMAGFDDGCAIDARGSLVQWDVTMAKHHVGSPLPGGLLTARTSQVNRTVCGQVQFQDESVTTAGWWSLLRTFGRAGRATFGVDVLFARFGGGCTGVESGMFNLGRFCELACGVLDGNQ